MHEGPLHAFWHPGPQHIWSRVLFAGLNLIVWVVTAICLFLALQWVDKPFPGFLVNERMVLSDYGLYHWSGVQAGLGQPDKILRANGMEVSSSEELYHFIGQLDVGEEVTYFIDRRGVVREETIRTMVFTWMDLVLTFGLTLVCGLIFLTLGFIVYILKPDTSMSWAFLLVCFFFGIFAISSFDVQSTHLGFIYLAFSLNGLSAGAFVHLGLVFPQKRKIVDRYPWIQLLPYAVGLVLALPIYLYYPIPEFKKYYVILLMFLVLSILSPIVSSLLAYFERTSVVARQRAKVALFGAAVAFPYPVVGLTISNYGGTLWGIPIQNNLSAIPILIFPAAISYAIFKHNLFDVDVFIKRTIGYGLVTALVGFAYFLVQTVVRTVVLDPIFGDSAEQVYPILFALLVVFLLNPLNRAVQDLVDRLFFRRQFDYKETVASISETLSSLLDRSAVVNALIDTVRKKMFVDTAGVFLAQGSQGQLSFVTVGGQAPPPQALDLSEEHLQQEDPLYALVARERTLITKYDIAEAPKYEEFRDICGRRFAELGASVALPLIHREEVRGVLTLGYKKSGYFYGREDIELLETLAHQGAVALENARLADQMLKEEMVRTNLARYLSPQIVDQIIEQDVQVNLGGARKTVTILFSDIRNFTSITESRPPDQLVAILNDYFTEMAKIIFANQGSLDKYIGDAIVSVFGSLIPLENSALHASRAAIQMIKKMPELNERWQKEFGFGMDMGIGLNTGEVFLGNVGSPERMEFTVIGDTVNVASRFSGLAKAGQVLMTRETLDLLNGAVQYEELPPSSVKGKADKLEVFLLDCAGEIPPDQGA